MMIVYNARLIFILVIYCVCYLFSFIRCRKEVLFWDLHSVDVLADSAQSSHENIGCVSWFTDFLADFVGQLNHAHKSRLTLSII